MTKAQITKSWIRTYCGDILLKAKAAGEDMNAVIKKLIDMNQEKIAEYAYQCDRFGIDN